MDSQRKLIKAACLRDTSPIDSGGAKCLIRAFGHKSLRDGIDIITIRRAFSTLENCAGPDPRDTRGGHSDDHIERVHLHRSQQNAVGTEQGLEVDWMVSPDN